MASIQFFFAVQAVRRESLEQRQLLANTIQVTIPVQVVSISAKTLQDTAVSFRLHDVVGTLTATGENLAAQTVGNTVNITGTVSEFNDLSLTTTTALSSIAVSSTVVDFPLGSFESMGPMKMIDLRPLSLNGNVSMLAAPKVQLGDGKAATINISQEIPFLNFTGGNFSNSLINFTAANPTAKAPVLSMKFNNLIDTHLNVQQFIKTLNLRSVAESTAGASGITANSAFAIGVASDFKADLTFKPTFGLRYTLDNYHVGGTASGRWTVPGATRLGYANLYDSGYVGNFGSIGGYAVGKDFSGALTAGSIGTAFIGHDMLNGSMMLTNNYAANSWNLGSISVGSTIENSTITSNGNLGTITTMYTYYSRIQAGLSSSYVFGQPLTMGSYSSNSVIKSFTSDCPSHHYTHFVGSYVGASDLQYVHLGNTQINNYNNPFGLAGVRMDRLSLLLNGKAVNMKSLTGIASLDAALRDLGLTEQDWEDFKFKFLY